MKALVLHLSDLHTMPQSRQFQERINGVSGVINQLAPGVSCCFIVISGDLCSSGCSDAYTFLEKQLRNLKHETESKKLFNSMEYVIVPGNHDLDLQLDSTARKILVNSVQENTGTAIDPSVIDILTKVQVPFFDFLWRICPEPQIREKKLYYRFVFDCDGIPIVFNCFNSAWMSTVPENQGKLRLPNVDFTVETGGSNPVLFSILHHPYNWFNAEDARNLKRLLQVNSNFILTGHEHDSDTYKVTDARGRVTDYIEGGVFNKDDSNQSSFNAIIVNVESRMSQVIQFTWSQGGYRPSFNGEWNPIQQRYSGSTFVVNPEYMKTLDSMDHDFNHPRKDQLLLSDIYVNPDLDRIASKGKANYLSVRVDDLKQLLRDEKHILVIGAQQLGKTALLKRLFCDLVSEGLMIPIIIDGRQLNKHNQDYVSDLIEKTFEISYNKESLDRYNQLTKTQKVLMVDNFDKAPLNFRGRDLVLKQLEDIFGYIILTSTSLIDIEELLEDKEMGLLEYERVTLSEFGHYLRGVLIEKWLRIGNQYNINETELKSRLKYLEHEINSVFGNHVLPYNPFIILTLLQAAEFNYDISTAAGAYGYYYEILIKHTISRTSLSTRDTGIRIGFLSCLAYYMFFNQKQEMNPDEMTQFCANVYRPYSKLTINSNQLLKALEASGVLTFEQDRYVFGHAYEYQYFVALFMADNFRNPDKTLRNQIEHIILKLCTNLHRENYANIVMFLSYLSKDPIVLDVLTTNADRLFNDVKPCDLDKDVQFINRLEPRKLLTSFADIPEGKSRETVLRSQDRIEREDNKELVSQGEVAEINELELLPSIAYSFALINILGQILKNYLGSLDSQHKQRIVDACCRLGLRVLETIFVNIENGLPELKEDYSQSLQRKERKLLESELNMRFTSYIFVISLTLSMLVVRNVTFAVGAPELELVYEDFRKELDILSVTFLNLSIQLEHYKRHPIAEVKNLHKYTKKNALADELLKQLVVLNLYLYPWPINERQQVLSELGLQKIQGEPRFLLPRRKLLKKADRGIS